MGWQIRVPVLDKMFLEDKTGAVQACVPLLIGLDVLDKYEFYLNTVENILLVHIYLWR